MSAVLEERRPVEHWPSLTLSRRPVNVVIVGRPDEPVDSMLKRLKQGMQRAGLHQRLRRGSHFWYAASKGQRRRLKHRAALAGQRKAVRRAAQIDARHAAAGR